MNKFKKKFLIGLMTLTSLFCVAFAGCATEPEKGDAGQDGSTWIVKTTEPEAGDGKDGDLFLNTVTYDLYLKTNGAWTKVGNIKGADGNNGTNGTNGENGSSFLVGITEPAVTVGSNGDAYLNTTTYDLYLKSEGVWTKLGNIKGADGNNGTNGSNGNGILAGSVAPDETVGVDGDLYLDTVKYDLYTKSQGSWAKLGNIKGVGVEKVEINEQGDLIIHLTDGTQQNAGQVNPAKIVFYVNGEDAKNSTIYTSESFAGDNYLNALSVSVKENDVEKEINVNVISGAEYVSVENGTITGVKKGVAEVSLQYTNTVGKEYKKTLTVTVEKPTKEYAQVIDYFSAMDGDLPISEIFGSNQTVLAATNLNDESNVLTVNANKVLGLSTQRGRVTKAYIALETAEGIMRVKLNAYTKVIDDANDLSVFDIANTSTIIDGYFIVKNDIAYDSNAPVNQHTGSGTKTTGFAGVFDGNGHKISFGVDKKGLFGRLLPKAVIKDVAMTDIVFTNMASNTNVYVVAEACTATTYENSLITNTYIEVEDFRSEINGNKTAVICKARPLYLRLDNVVLNITAPENADAAAYGVGALFSYDSNNYSDNVLKTPNSLTNVYVVSTMPYMARVSLDDGQYRNFWASNEEGKTFDYDNHSIVYGGVYRYDTMEDLGTNNTTSWKIVNNELVYDEESFILEEGVYKIQGRGYAYGDSVKFELPNTGIDVAFNGSSVSATLQNSSGIDGRVKVFIDGDTEGESIFLKPYEVYSYEKTGLADGKHTIRIINAFEDGFGFILRDIQANEFVPIGGEDKLKIEIIGDSITAGYGAGMRESEPRTVENSDSTLSYSYLVGQMLDADFSVVARQGITISAPKKSSMLNYLYDSYAITNPDVFTGGDNDLVILNLGTNDSANYTNYASAGMSFADEYLKMLQKIREANPNAQIVCVYGMMTKANDDAVRADIIKAVEQMNDSKICYKLDFTPANAGHPVATEHIANAQILVDFIKSIIE